MHRTKFVSWDSTIHCLLAVAASIVLVACGGGSSSAPSAAPVAVDLAEVPLRYTSPPSLNESTSVELGTAQSVGSIAWTVLEQPAGANLVVTPSSDGKSATFTPVVAGWYVIEARADSGGSPKRWGFAVASRFPFSPAKVSGLSDPTDLEKVIGAIVNQSWVRSTSLSEAELRALVSSAGVFNIIGYDRVLGLLVEFDEGNPAHLSALAALAQTRGITEVLPRVHEGRLVPRALRLPSDGSTFGDGGANWHLENMRAEQAWNHTTGSNAVRIGVTDEWAAGAYLSSHAELAGRIACAESAGLGPDANHGFSVAGAIAASPSIGAGATGVNWISNLLLEPSWGYAALTALTSAPAVTSAGPSCALPQVINASWGVVGSYVETTDINADGTVKPSRHDLAFTNSRAYRAMAVANPNVLFVFAAGNGVENGKGVDISAIDAVYGVDARAENGAIHLDAMRSLAKLPNVLVVAAMNGDEKLVHYSAYGDTIDIAAPTGFKSLTSGGGYTTDPTKPFEGYGSGSKPAFGGTSAAAPLVTGVASLVLSINPRLRAADVKKIILDSAATAGAGGKGRWVRQRKTDLVFSDDLVHPIPVLDAEAAVLMAKLFNATLSVDFPDPFDSAARVRVSSGDPGVEIRGFDYELEVSSDGGGTWAARPGASILGQSASVPIGATGELFRIAATIYSTRTSDGASVSERVEEVFGLTRVNVFATDSTTSLPLAGVSVAFEGYTGTPLTGSKRTGADGRLQAYVQPVSYRVRGSLPGYRDATTSASFGPGGAVEANLRLVAVGAAPTGSFGGRVIDAATGMPIAGATVRISGREQTGGFFQSTVTDVRGMYRLDGISELGSDGKPIYGFDLEASAPGYLTRPARAMLVTGAVYPLDFLTERGISPVPPPPPAPSGPDLIAHAIGFAPTSALPSTPVTVNFNVLNQGDTAASPSTAVIRITTSATSAAGPNLATDSIPMLLAGASLSRSLTVSAPTTPGTYRVWVIADNFSTAGQSAAAAGNDIVLASGTLTVNPAPVSGPDLVPQSVSFSPGSAPPGGRVSVLFNIRNTGTTTAGASTAAIRITSSSTSPLGTDAATVSVGTLAAGAASAHSALVTVPTAPGSYRVWVLADTAGSAGQPSSALANDATLAALTLTVADSTAPSPDLVPLSISVDPTSITAGGMTLVTFTIANTGSATSATSLAVVRVNTSSTSAAGSDLATVLVPALPAGGSMTRTVGVRVASAPGSYRVWIVADSNGSAGQISGAAIANDAALATSPLTLTPRVIPPSGSAEGAYGGTLTGSTSRAFRMLVLENGEFWAPYGVLSGGNLLVSGFVQGTMTSSAGTLVSTDVKDFGLPFPPTGMATGTYDAAAGSLSGTITSAAGTVAVSGGPITEIPYEYHRPAALGDLVATWSVSTSTGDTMTLTVRSDGTFSARTTLGCDLSGSVAPRPSGKNVFNVALTFGGSPCLLAGQSMTGVAVFTKLPDGKPQVTIGVVNATRTAGLMASGVR